MSRYKRHGAGSVPLPFEILGQRIRRGFRSTAHPVVVSVRLPIPLLGTTDGSIAVSTATEPMIRKG
jgi:hypothetical protein